MKPQPVFQMRFAVRVYSPKILRRILVFSQSVARHWGTLVTGGVVIGLLGMWQQTGHFVWTLCYWSVALTSFFIACFKAWNEKEELLEIQTVQMKEPKLLIEHVENMEPTHELKPLIK
jgi:hypothetical protein